MKVQHYTLILSVAILASACSHGFYYKPDPSVTEQKDIIYSQGAAWSVSQLPNTSVMITAIKPASGELELVIGYMNNNAQRADAIPEHIKVSYINGKNLKAVYVYSADRYLAKVQNKQNWQMAAQAFSAGMNNANAGYSASSTTAAAVSSNGTYVVGASKTVAYDGSKVAEANYRSRQELQSMANSYAQHNQSLSESLVRANTLFKGQSMQGYVIVNTGNSFDKQIYVEVPFGDDVHTFSLVPNR